jgi:hypothetical protein
VSAQKCESYDGMSLSYDIFLGVSALISAVYGLYGGSQVISGEVGTNILKNDAHRRLPEGLTLS